MPARRAGHSDTTEPPSADDGMFALLGALTPGTELGQYIIEKTIGGGGCGIVYAARHHALRQRVAIKVMRGELTLFPSTVTRFLREAEAVHRIRHPNIVTIHDFGEIAPGLPYYVMELLEGVELREHLAQHGRFSPREALELFAPVCEAVAAAHAAKIIHRDIKANNVMVAEIGGKRVVKLLDFGIAKMLQTESSGPGLTEPGARIGTARNMAPEQIRGERVDERADIYALGVLLYQLLTGEYPFHGDQPRQLAVLHLQAPPPRPSAIAPVPPEIDAVVLRCLEKEPDKRFQSVTALLEALKSAVGDAVDEPVERPAMAVALYLEVATDAEADEDATMDDLIEVLDTVEQALAEREFLFPLRSSNALLGVRLIELAQLEHERAEINALRDELEARLASRPHAAEGVIPTLSVTVGEVLHRRSEGNVEVVGGPVLALDEWTDLPKR